MTSPARDPMREIFSREPVLALSYGPSGIGKTTDTGLSFPNALFIAAPGALQSIRNVAGYEPLVEHAVTIPDVTKLINTIGSYKAKGSDTKIDAIVADDFSYLAEQTFAQLEKKFNGFRLWGELRDAIIDFRNASRFAKVHIIVNCFSRDTEFVTEAGVSSFYNFDHGDTTKVLTHTGSWKNAVVKSYGMRPMQRITIRRGPARHVVTATPDHRWLLADGSETTKLVKGDRLLTAPSIFNDFDFSKASLDAKLAWVRGFHYGDGTTDARGYANVRLCKKKARFASRFAELGFTSRTPDWANGDVMVNLAKMPKVIPVGFATAEEAQAYVAGYLAADGHINKSKRSRCYNPFTGLQTSDKSMAAFIRKFFPTAGVYLVSDSPVTRTTNYGTHDATWFTTVEGFSEHPVAAFIVDDIESVAEAEAWCLEVEDDHSLVLPFGVSTGNCWEQAPKDKPGGARVKGGPMLSGNLPEQVPAMFDMVLRCGLDPMRKPWPGIYQCVADPNYTMKDRLNIATLCHPAPMNMAELIRAADYPVSRHPDLHWQEEIVEKVAQQMVAEGAARDKDIANGVYADLIKNGVRPPHARWTLRDALDRTVIRRAKAIKDAQFLT